MVMANGAWLPQTHLTRYTYSEVHMGMEARIVVYAETEQQAQEACSAAFRRIGQLDAIMSDYKPDSELNKLCAAPANQPVRVSADLWRVLTKASQVSRETKGAFDVTAGPVIRLWRAARKSKKLPDPTALQAAMRLVGRDKMRLDPTSRTVTLSHAGMQLDLGGIAKGYAGDAAQRVLKQHGISRALVEFGGDIVVTGPPPGKAGWTILVPNATADGAKELEFKHCAVSTSGDTEQFTIIDGVQYSHVVDPRTGQALTNRIQSTVIVQYGLDSDPMSTALTVMSPAERGEYLRLHTKAKVFIKSLK